MNADQYCQGEKSKQNHIGSSRYKYTLVETSKVLELTCLLVCAVKLSTLNLVFFIIDILFCT